MSNPSELNATNQPVQSNPIHAVKNLTIDLKLSETNYSFWRSRMIGLLVMQNLATVTEDEVGNEAITFHNTAKEKQLARFCITGHLSEVIGQSMMREKDPAVIWKKLETKYSGLNTGRKIIGIRKLCKYSFNRTETVDKNVSDLKTILYDLLTAAGSLSVTYEELACSVLLHSLPLEFSSQRTSLADKKIANLDEIEVELLKEEQILQASNKDSKNFGNEFSGAAFKKRKRTWPADTEVCEHNWDRSTCNRCDPSKLAKNSVCIDCKQPGHRTNNSERCGNHSPRKEFTGLAKFKKDEDDFPKPFRGEFAGMTNSKRQKFTSEQVDVYKPKAFGANDLRWVIDSGCSKSLLRNKGGIKNYTNEKIEMAVADKTADPMICPGTGSHQINSNILLQNVLYCPDVALNLLSVSQLADLGLTITFDSTKCVVKRKDNNEIVLTGRRENNLYVYQRTKHGEAYFTSKGKTPIKTELFHRRMGHLNERDLRSLQGLAEGVTLDKQPLSGCTSCVLAKSHRRQFDKSTSRAKRFGELTHTDVCSIGIPTILGAYTMFVLFIDDSTRWITIYLLSSKSDVGDTFFDYDKIVFNQTSRHCQVLRSDGGNEYFRTSVKDYCNEHGILHQSSTRETPQQNGRAERPNRSVVEGVSAMLFDKNLPMSFWGWAALCFVYLKNRSPHAALRSLTPFEARYHEIPDLSMVRVFGTPCYMYLSKKHRIAYDGEAAKLLPHARRMIFIGYSSKYKAWKLFDPEREKEMYSSEVYFEDELEIHSPHTEKEKLTLAKFVAPEEYNVVKETEEIDVPAVSTTLTETVDNAVLEPVQESVAEEDNQDDQDDQDELVSYDAPTSVDNIYLALLAKEETEDAPSFKTAMAGVHRVKFQIAIDQEYKSLEDNNVFSQPCILPKGFRALDTKMVLKIKEAENSSSERRFKARLCGKGFRQIYGVDYFDTFSPVATFDSLRIFLTLMAMMDYEMDVVDVVTAFLLAPLKEEVYINIPDGYPNKEKYQGKVLRLLKSLYGLKQAPREWNKELDLYLSQIGFRPLKSERCIYVGRFGDNGKIVCYILVYVDDLILGCPDRSLMAKLKSQIKRKFPLSDKGPISFYLNIHITRDRLARTVSIHQMSKIERILQDARLTKEELIMVEKPCKIPASDDFPLTKDMCPVTQDDIKAMESVPFRSFIGILLHIAITARPDILPSVSAAAKYCQNPGREHWNAVLRILKYLQGTRKMKLCFGGKSNVLCVNGKFSLIRASSDADWAKDLDQRKSRTGFAIYLFESLVIWSSKLQSTVAQSSTEAEYLALAACARTVIWLRSLLTEMGFPPSGPSTIEEDNKACIDISQSHRAHPAVKHIDIRYHFIRDHVQDIKDIKLEKRPSAEMTADLFTKQLSYPLFSKHRAKLGLYLD